MYTPRALVKTIHISRQRTYQRRLRYNKTVLYVVTAWVDDQSVPRLHHLLLNMIQLLW